MTSQRTPRANPFGDSASCARAPSPIARSTCSTKSRSPAWLRPPSGGDLEVENDLAARATFEQHPVGIRNAFQRERGRDREDDLDRRDGLGDRDERIL